MGYTCSGVGQWTGICLELLIDTKTENFPKSRSRARRLLKRMATAGEIIHDYE